MMNITSIISAVVIGGASLTVGLDGLDSSIDSLIAAKKMEQHAICTARVGSMLLTVHQRVDAETSCKLFSDKEVDDKFVAIKQLIGSVRTSI